LASHSPLHLAVANELSRVARLTGVAFTAQGAFKETYRAEKTSGVAVALKILDPAKCDLARSSREIEAMQRCDSPFIAKLFDSGTFHAADGKDYLFSIEEYLDGGTLSQKLANGVLSIDIIKSYGRCLSDALEHLRSLNLVHRDIKPDNIMFRANESVPILVDFGLVRDLSAISLTQTWLPQGPGTPYYAAPEQLRNEKPLIGWRTDQFSLGIVLGISMTGRHPFERVGMTMPQTVGAVAARQPCSAQFVQAASNAGLSGMVRMLAPWPIHRYSSPARLLQVFQT
jgi:serine/threonine protein kinase